MDHTSDETDGLEALWEQLLSRQAVLVRQAFAALDPDAQRAVQAHLRRMAEEPGWHVEQRTSAQAALNAIQ
jgi:hypothetical protein